MSDTTQRSLADVKFDFSKLDLEQNLMFVLASEEMTTAETQELLRAIRGIAVGGLKGIKATVPELVKAAYEAYGDWANPKAGTSPSETG